MSTNICADALYISMKIFFALLLAGLTFTASGTTLPTVASTSATVVAKKISPKAITKKVKILRSNPHHKILLVINDDDDDDFDGDELAPFYRRAKVTPQQSKTDDADVSDYVKTRLLIARARALQKYQEKWV